MNEEANEKKQTVIEVTFEFLKQAYQAGDIKSSRSKMDVFADRLTRSLTCPTLLLAMEDLLRGISAEAERMHPQAVAEMIAVSGDSLAKAMLCWLRQHTKLAAMLAGVRDESLFREALSGIDLAETSEVVDPGNGPQAGCFDIGMSVTCLSPLAHGADGKAGNSTLFRRQQVLSSTGQILTLPFYSGNAIRGQMRDLLADHFLEAMGIKPSLWFFYALYSGGALEENAASTKALAKKLGDNGSIRTEGIREFRLKMIPLSLLGCALGNRVLPGSIQVGELRPACLEWGTGTLPASSLLTWEFLTRREDDECHAENHSMIANTEVLKAGTELRGGINIDHSANALARACLGRALALLQERGQLGAENRRGLGRVSISYEHAPEPAAYDEHLRSNKGEIVEYLRSIGAIDDGKEQKKPEKSEPVAEAPEPGQKDLF
jgi:hypothetical protein